MLWIVRLQRNLLTASRPLSCATSSSVFTIAWQPVVPAALHEKLHERMEGVIREAKDKEKEADMLRLSNTSLIADIVRLSSRNDLRGLTEGTLKSLARYDPAIAAACAKKFGKGKIPGVQEILRIVYNFELKKPAGGAVGSAPPASLRQHVRQMCVKVKTLDEHAVETILLNRIYHDLSKGLHGSSAMPCTIFERGKSGWEPNEAAALSALLDFFELDYEFVAGEDKVDPPPYRL